MSDPLSEMLRSLRLSGCIFLDAQFTAPWSVLSQVRPEDWRGYLDTSGPVISFHYVIAGELVAQIGDKAPVSLRAGDIVLLPRNESHILASAPGLPTVLADTLVQRGPDGGIMRIRHGGGGAPSQLICGFLGSEGGDHPLFATLPRLLKLDVRAAASGAWIESSVRFAAEELTRGRVAQASLVSRLSETLLIEALRHYLATEGEGAAGWLRGLRDPQVGRALTLIHRDLAAPWTAETLAREVAMSRSAFMDRFRDLVGMPPTRYQTVVRLQRACQELHRGGRSVAQVAHAVGYESEEAFSRAFRREYGVSPSRWRDGEGEERTRSAGVSPAPWQSAGAGGLRP